MPGEPPKRLNPLNDDEGKPSSMRYMSAACLITAIGIAIWMVSASDPVEPGMDLVLLFLVAAFAPKTLQKFAERFKG